LGRLDDVEVGILTVGVGPDKAYRRARAALELWEPMRVLSFGTCGALVDGLMEGALVTAHRISGPDGSGVDVKPLPSFRAVDVVTVEVPVWTADRREELAGVGHDVVEMEAYAVWQAVRAHSSDLPFAALKVVSDQAGGVPDPALDADVTPNQGRRAIKIAQFKARALKLSETKMAPAVLGLINTRSASG